MHNYHSWTAGLGKRNIQCLIFAMSLLNYIIDTKSLVCLSVIFIELNEFICFMLYLYLYHYSLKLNKNQILHYLILKEDLQFCYHID